MKLKYLLWKINSCVGTQVVASANAYGEGGNDYDEDININ